MKVNWNIVPCRYCISVLRGYINARFLALLCIYTSYNFVIIGLGNTVSPICYQAKILAKGFWS